MKFPPKLSAFLLIIGALCAIPFSAKLQPVSAPMCSGVAPISQIPTDYTSKMSFVAAGVKIEQLTNVGTNRFYYFDVPAFGRNSILYTNTIKQNVIALAHQDGSGAQQISPTATGNQAFMSWDQKLVYYPKPVKGGTPGGQDIYGEMPFSSGAKCVEFRITTLDAKPIAPLPVEEISSTSAAPNGGWDILFSPDTLLHGVQVFANSTSATLPTYTLKDPEAAGTFHRIRGNPVFPNIVMWKRNHTLGTSAFDEVWLADLNTCENFVCNAAQIINVVANVKIPGGRQPAGGHIAWSPDGRTIAFSEIHISDYWLARNVVNANGTINAAFTVQELGPFVRPQITADYCAFPRDWPTSTLMACLAGPAAIVDAKMLYLLSTDGKGTFKDIVETDAQVLTIGGTPMMQFAQDDTHLLFNSDKTGVAQVYEASGFTYQVP